jgi:hypothetical protein
MQQRKSIPLHTARRQKRPAPEGLVMDTLCVRYLTTLSITKITERQSQINDSMEHW